ncbi:hypothetical protein CRG98_007325 [Punica granatum]|uniref:Uncharacterized protein n=1 Tax=Punica granatum TaxID=22663 RepID=A0A2I0KUW0_PUNGR|nr:hypothetical protein CRG98_007325 [Punica granatum]
MGPEPDAVNAGPEPDAGPKPNVVNERPKLDAEPKPNAGPKPNSGAEARCNRGWSTLEGWHNSPVMRGGWPRWMASGHSTSRHGEVKTASGLPTKVGTTCLSCGTW